MRLGQRLALLGGARDRRQRGVFRRRAGRPPPWLPIRPGCSWPLKLLAVSCTRSLWPTSAATERVGLGRSRPRSRSSSARGVAAQPLVGVAVSGKLVQDPCASVSVWPCCAVPRDRRRGRCSAADQAEGGGRRHQPPAQARHPHARRRARGRRTARVSSGRMCGVAVNMASGGLRREREARSGRRGRARGARL